MGLSYHTVNSYLDFLWGEMGTSDLFLYLRIYGDRLNKLYASQSRIDLCGIALAKAHTASALHHIIIRGIVHKKLF